MNRVLVDTSVWIDFFNGEDSEQSLVLQKLIRNGEVYLCPTIYQEILQGIKDDTQFADIKRILGLFDVVHVDFPIASRYSC